MALPMQGNELLPCGQDVIRRRFGPRTPDRRGGDGLADAAGNVGKTAPAKFRHDGVPVRRSIVGKNVEQRGLEVGGQRVTKLEPGQFLEMVVQQPGMIDRGLQDQRLAPGNGGAIAAMYRACRQLRAYDLIAVTPRGRKRASSG